MHPLNHAPQISAFRQVRPRPETSSHSTQPFTVSTLHLHVLSQRHLISLANKPSYQKPPVPYLRYYLTLDYSPPSLVLHLSTLTRNFNFATCPKSKNANALSSSSKCRSNYTRFTCTFRHEALLVPSNPGLTASKHGVRFRIFKHPLLKAQIQLPEDDKAFNSDLRDQVTTIMELIGCFSPSFSSTKTSIPKHRYRNINTLFLHYQNISTQTLISYVFNAETARY
ncbi:hypothetical protein B0J14DRAFT_199942 [Halenospora varia]|nr:hypothetical protein B0J14DRAFT_199942 [Halenospora varia]